MLPAQLEAMRSKLSNRAKLALVAAAALVVAPVIWFVVKGLVGLAVAGIVGLAIVQFAPVISMKFANWKIKGIKAEAEENPIETMENLLIAKKQAFAVAQEEVTNGVTARDEFKRKIAEFAKKYPARAPEFTAQLAAMTSLVEQKKAALSDAQDAIAMAEQKLDEMRAYWDMSLAAQAANKAMKMDTHDLYEKMKEDTAVDAVYASMNKAFAQLEVAAALKEPEPLAPLAIEESVQVVEPVDFGRAQALHLPPAWPGDTEARYRK